MNNPHVTPIRLAGLGMDEHARRMLQMVFQSRSKGAYVVVEENLAEAVIFDLDGFGARELWEAFRARHPHMPAIVMSLRQKNPPDALYIKKPVDVSELLQALEKIKQQVMEHRRTVSQLAEPLHYTPRKDSTQEKTVSGQGESSAASQVSPAGDSNRQGANKSGLHDVSRHMEQTSMRRSGGYAEDSVCGQHPDVDPRHSKHTELEKVFYHPEHHLQGLVQKGVEIVKGQSSGVKLNGLSGGQLILLPHKNQVLYDINEEQLRALCTMPVNLRQVNIVPVSAAQISRIVQEATSPLRYYYLDRFIWQISIWSARGRLPAGTQLDIPIILLHWPNFTRLLITPHALQITALWIEQPYSLLDTARILNIPQRYVFSFYAACHALSLAFMDRRQGARRADMDEYPKKKNSDRQSPVPNAKRSLFQRILSHLHLD